MKVSVIVPAYNLENYIEACLLSLISQKVSFDFEILVGDDCSTDQTCNIIRNIASQHSQIKPVFKRTNNGLAENMKSLLKLAQGEYIAYLDGDDIALPGKLQKQVDFLETNKAYDMVFHESEVFKSETNQMIKLYSKDFYNWSLIPKVSDIHHLIKYGTYMQASSVLFRRHESLTHCVLNECKIVLDYAFYIMNAGYLNAKIGFIPEVLGRYRIHANSFGAKTQRDKSRRYQSLEDIIFACKSAAKFGVSQHIIEEGITHHQFAAALYFLVRGQYEDFNKLIAKSSANSQFVNSRHELAWQNRTDPDLVKQLLFE